MIGFGGSFWKLPMLSVFSFIAVSVLLSSSSLIFLGCHVRGSPSFVLRGMMLSMVWG